MAGVAFAYADRAADRVHRSNPATKPAAAAAPNGGAGAGGGKRGALPPLESRPRTAGGGRNPTAASGRPTTAAGGMPAEGGRGGLHNGHRGRPASAAVRPVRMVHVRKEGYGTVGMMPAT